MAFQYSRTTSTVVGATVVTLGLMGWVRFTGGSPAEPEATSQASDVALPIEPIQPLEADGDGGAAQIEAAFVERSSDRSVQVRGLVKRLLSDDQGENARRQRFMLELSDGRLLLVVHELLGDQRVPLELGDAIELRGRYQWNNRGGQVLGTHHDPLSESPGGWIRHAGTDYR